MEDIYSDRKTKNKNRKQRDVVVFSSIWLFDVLWRNIKRALFEFNAGESGMV